MRAELVVKALLDADTAVQSILSGQVFPCLAPLTSPAKKPPYVVYALEGATREPTVSFAVITQVTATVSVMAVALDYAGVKALLEACRIAVAYKYGTIAGVVVSQITVGDEGPDLYQPDLRWYAQSMNFVVVHQE